MQVVLHNGHKIVVVVVVVLWCRAGELFPRATYDAELGHMVEWRGAVQQQLTQTIRIPARNIAKQKALTAAATMVCRLLVFRVASRLKSREIEHLSFWGRAVVC